MRLDLLNVTAGYGRTTVLRDVTLAVPDGTVVALLGPNGAGKTTLLGAASGLVPVSSGTVALDDQDVTSRRPGARAERGLCHITDGRAILPGLTVRDNLRMFNVDGDHKTGIDRAVDAFPRLGERLNQTAGTMSGGEQQMLALSRIHVQQAPLVLLDEVSMGLAPIIVDEIFEFLRRVAEAGTTLLIVEQYVTRALDLADHVYLLSRGRIAFAGETREVDGVDLFEQYLGADFAPAR